MKVPWINSDKPDVGGQSNSSRPFSLRRTIVEQRFGKWAAASDAGVPGVAASFVELFQAIGAGVANENFKLL